MRESEREIEEEREGEREREREGEGGCERYNEKQVSHVELFKIGCCNKVCGQTGFTPKILPNTQIEKEEKQ